MSTDGPTTFGRFRSLLGGGKSEEVRPVESGSVPALSGNEQQQALLLLRDYESSGLGWFWSSDHEGKITYISDCVAQRMGAVRSSLLGRAVQSLFLLERDEDDARERTLPLILSARKTFADLQVRAALDDNGVTPLCSLKVPARRCGCPARSIGPIKRSEKRAGYHGWRQRSHFSRTVPLQSIRLSRCARC